MIAQIAGTIAEVRSDSVVIIVGGIGLLVMSSPSTIATIRVGDVISMHTSMVVREDSLTLFGFESKESRDMFDVVQSVSGFGPRLAFTLVSHMPPEELRTAIANENIAALKATPGVGVKGAQRLVLELKDKIGYVAAPNLGLSTQDQWRDQVVSALMGLGWSQRESNDAMAQLITDSRALREQGNPIEDVSDALRRALQILGQP